MTATYTYKGWTYRPLEELSNDNIKIWHDFEHAAGRCVTCDFSPYQSMTSEDIRLWIDLGMPDRIGSAPLDSFDLNCLWNEEND